MDFKDILIDLIIEKTHGSQKELAVEAGIPATTINSWIKNDTKPTYTQLIKLANFFNVPADLLLGRENYIGIKNYTNSFLSDDQKELLNLYNQMSFKEKNQLLGFAKALIY